MSHRYTKIKYNEEGAWGSTEEHILYCHENFTCDVTSVYGEDGDYARICYNDTVDNGFFDQLKKLIEQSPETCTEIEYMTYEEIEKIFRPLT